jgi:DNA-binding HxlR family transcriptional regulator
VGDAWSWLVMRDVIFDDVNRFDDFQAGLGIARSTLTARLNHLMAGGLLAKRQDPRRLSHTIYVPTEMGLDFFDCLMTAMGWGDRWATNGRARPRLLIHEVCGSRLDAELVCSACSEPLRASEVRVAQWNARPEPHIHPERSRSRTPELSLLERERPCSIARTLKIIGDRWSGLVLRAAFFGTRRFDDFHRELQIAQSVLSQRLTRLVDAGILRRRAYQDNPPRDEYVFTEKGRDLYPIYVALLAWGDRWLAPDDGGTMVLEHRTCKHSLAPMLVCTTCRRMLAHDEIHTKE